MRQILTLAALTALAACSASNNVNFTDSSSGSGGSTGTTGHGGGSTGTGATGTGATGTGATGTGATGTGATGTGATGTGASGTGGGIIIDAGPIPDGGTAPTEVYGHSPDTLYKLDPNTKVVSLVGPFQGCNAASAAVIDLALDKDGNMYVTTFGGFYKVDKTNAVCTHIADGGYPNSLSFVPKGTLDPNVEALVGYEGSTYVRIDTTSGAVTTVGSLGTQGYISSGDVVSVIGGGTYLTVQAGPENCSDCIVEVDPKTGVFVKMIGANLGHFDVYGLAFWGGAAYGFDDSGKLFQIDLTNGTHTDIPIPNAPPGLIWYGAGSTTSAPLTSQ